MSSSDYQIVTADKIREGDILLGTITNSNQLYPFTTGWRVKKARQAGKFIRLNMVSLADGFAVSDWNAGVYTSRYAIRFRELKYDPMQQGDTDEDI